jgi:hypothetical protein
MPDDRPDSRTQERRWEALMRQPQTLSLNKDTGAARLLQRIRKQFPTNASPAEKHLMVVSDEDMKL